MKQKAYPKKTKKNSKKKIIPKRGKRSGLSALQYHPSKETRDTSMRLLGGKPKPKKKKLTTKKK